jgi:CubicO group peptidase (beta-lactamase class C family)
MTDALGNEAAYPARGSYADGYALLANTFSTQIREGLEIGAGLCVYRHGVCVADLWGGYADRESETLWSADTLMVVFSVTKGFAAMALNHLADRGKFEWDAPVATIWPEFARAGKEGISFRTLFNHQGGLAALDIPLTISDCCEPERVHRLRAALESQRPLWKPGDGQGYHAVTFGMYAREVIERIAGEPISDYLKREIFAPLDADVWLGTPATEDARVATLYPVPLGERLGRMAVEIVRGGTTEARVARATVALKSVGRRAFLNPRPGSLSDYNAPPIRRASLAWASATATARGLARSYLPLSVNGAFEGKRYFDPKTIAALRERQGWSEADAVLCKPLGWSQGFLKEQRGVFSPNTESFGHPGMGGSLGWCDPVSGTAMGYVMNRMDWRVRSPRAIALCAALSQCEPVRA